MCLGWMGKGARVIKVKEEPNSKYRSCNSCLSKRDLIMISVGTESNSSATILCLSCAENLVNEIRYLINTRSESENDN